jgi:acyl-CoA dehydrogenase
MDDSLHTVQESLTGVLRNFPVPGIGRLVKWIVFPWGAPYSPPSDRTVHAAADLLLTENESRDRLVSGIYQSDLDDASGKVHSAFHLVLTATRAESAIRNALKEPVTYENHRDLVKKAVESGVITEEQATTVRLAQQAARAVIEVDDFARAEIEAAK